MQLQRWWQPLAWGSFGAASTRQLGDSGPALTPRLEAALAQAASLAGLLLREAHADSHTATEQAPARTSSSAPPPPLATAYRASLLQPLLAFMREPAAAAAAAAVATGGGASAVAGGLEPALGALPPAPSAAALAALEAAALANWDGPQPQQVRACGHGGWVRACVHGSPLLLANCAYSVACPHRRLLPPQVVALVWALAWAGHTPGPEYLRRLQVGATGARAAECKIRVGP